MNSDHRQCQCDACQGIEWDLPSTRHTVYIRRHGVFGSGFSLVEAQISWYRNLLLRNMLKRMSKNVGVYISLITWNTLTGKEITKYDSV